MLAAIPILGDLIHWGATWIQGRQQITAAKVQAKAAAVQQQGNNALHWSLAEIGVSDKWIRRVSFTMFAFPLVWAAVNPAEVHQYFTVGLAGIPVWWIKAFMGMNAAVWGVAELRQSMRAVKMAKAIVAGTAQAGGSDAAD